VTITEFLTARYDEEERQANAARGILGMEIAWHATADLHRLSNFTLADAAYVASRPPSLALADVAAKRAIVKFADVVDGMAETIYQEFSSYPDDEGADLLKILVQPYADHPDFDPAWRVA
jgi:hypothetical protein